METNTVTFDMNEKINWVKNLAEALKEKKKFKLIPPWFEKGEECPFYIEVQKNTYNDDVSYMFTLRRKGFKYHNDGAWLIVNNLDHMSPQTLCSALMLCIMDWDDMESLQLWKSYNI